ncbi:MAG: PIG-L family deacetylase [Chloroflexi bacterium]|nr:PIG-L family deacetylase [Chloroflexota bacterium]
MFHSGDKLIFETILPIPDIFSAKRILCVQPHYDDNDIAAGGTFAQLAKNGTEVIYLTVTDDLMGVVDTSLSPDAAAQSLTQDQLVAGKIIGVKQQILLNYPDAGVYDYFSLRRDLLKYIHMLQPDFVFTCDPWLTYEAHRDHIQTGLAVAEAVLFSSLPRIASSDLKVDEAYTGHSIHGIAFYYSREPNQIVDITSTWEKKILAVRSYATQIPSEDADQLVMALQFKSQQICAGKDFQYGEPLKVLNPKALHCGL